MKRPEFSLEFREELRGIQSLLIENLHLKRSEWDIYYNSLINDLEQKFPYEIKTYWKWKDFLSSKFSHGSLARAVKLLSK